MSSTTVIGQRFELRERVFSEGTQAAYLGHDRARGQDVLVLLVPPRARLSPEAEQALRAEIDRAFAISAPALLPVWDLVEAGEHRFLVMPRPRGVNAWDRITQPGAAGRLDPAEAALVADDWIAAARAAHAHGQRLFGSPRQAWVGRGRAQAHFAWVGRTRGAAPGDATAAALEAQGAEGAYFRAPECAQGEPADPAAADQYFIAALLYGLLTGEVPGGRLAPVRGTRRDVPVLLARAIEKALAQDPRDRHPDLDAFREALYRRRPPLARLVPAALLLLSLWAGWALFEGGVGPAEWVLSARREARWRAAAGRARAPEPLPAPEPAEGRSLAGVYRGPDGVELRLDADGNYELLDRGVAPPHHALGVWAPRAEPAGGWRLLALEADGAFGREARARPEAGGLGLEVPHRPGAPLVLAKVLWPGEAGAGLEPLLTLDAPLEGAVTAGATVAVRGRVARPRASVTVAGTSVPVVGGRFEHVLEAVAPGPFTLTVEARDPDGFVQRVARGLWRDDAPPRVRIDRAVLAEEGGLWRLRVEGTVHDEGGIAELTVNGVAVAPAADGSFAFERQGPEALARPLAEVVAVDRAGRRARALDWPRIEGVPAERLDPLRAAALEALASASPGEARARLKALRDGDGWLERIPPEALERLVLGSRPPQVTLDAHPEPPAWFEDDGTRHVGLAGTVEWFAPGDELTVRGLPVEVRDQRFEARVQLPGLGEHTIPVRVSRGGTEVLQLDVPVRLADAPRTFREWTGAAPTRRQVEASARFGLPLTVEVRAGTSTLRFVLVPPGEIERRDAAGRPFQVGVRRPYYVQVTEVTRELFEGHGGPAGPPLYQTRSGEKIPLSGPRLPAVGMTRAQAEDVAARLSEVTGRRLRLPTEAEWEWAARAGDLAASAYWGEGVERLAEWANLADLSLRQVAPRWPLERLESGVDDGHAGPWEAGRGRPNAFGVRDMLGNVAEWVADGHADYDPAQVVDPRAPREGRDGVHRGGGWLDRRTEARFDARGRQPPAKGLAWLGFRLLLEAEVR